MVNGDIKQCKCPNSCSKERETEGEIKTVTLDPEKRRGERKKWDRLGEMKKDKQILWQRDRRNRDRHRDRHTLCKEIQRKFLTLIVF